MGSISSNILGEILVIDFMTLENCKGGIENILVMIDVALKFTQAVETKEQKASTVVKVSER